MPFSEPKRDKVRQTRHKAQGLVATINPLQHSKGGASNPHALLAALALELESTWRAALGKANRGG